MCTITHPPPRPIILLYEVSSWIYRERAECNLRAVRLRMERLSSRHFKSHHFRCTSRVKQYVRPHCVGAKKTPRRSIPGRACDISLSWRDVVVRRQQYVLIVLFQFSHSKAGKGGCMLAQTINRLIQCEPIPVIIPAIPQNGQVWEPRPRTYAAKCAVGDRSLSSPCDLWQCVQRERVRRSMCMKAFSFINSRSCFEPPRTALFFENLAWIWGSGPVSRGSLRPCQKAFPYIKLCLDAWCYVSWSTLPL